MNKQRAWYLCFRYPKGNSPSYPYVNKYTDTPCILSLSIPWKAFSQQAQRSHPRRPPRPAAAWPTSAVQRSGPPSRRRKHKEIAPAVRGAVLLAAAPPPPPSAHCRSVSGLVSRAAGAERYQAPQVPSRHFPICRRCCYYRRRCCSCCCCC